MSSTAASSGGEEYGIECALARVCESHAFYLTFEGDCMWCESHVRYATARRVVVWFGVCVFVQLNRLSVSRCCDEATIIGEREPIRRRSLRRLVELRVSIVVWTEISMRARCRRARACGRRQRRLYVY